ncbi:MFS transporter, partial [Micromonospora aurantiaca]|nr:MFS transporter [Micromonospora aurantiaca]
YLPAWRAARRTPQDVTVEPEATAGPGHSGLAPEPAGPSLDAAAAPAGRD